MNKEYMYVNGNILISTENGMKEPIPYRDNIEDILVFENQISFLQKSLEADEKKLQSDREEVEYRKSSSKKIAAVTSGTVVVAAVAAHAIAYSVAGEELAMVVGELTKGLAVTGVGFGCVLGLIDYSYRPSKNILRCYEERIAYEREMIDLLSKELEELKNDVTVNRKGAVQEMVSYEVRDEDSIEFLREAIKLRDIYGYNTKKFMKMYFNGELLEFLQNGEFSDCAIMDFMSFLDNKVKLEEQENRMGKK